MPNTTHFKIANLIIKPDLLVVESDKGTNKIEPRLMSVLVFLYQNQNQLVSRDDLIEHVWQGAIVSDNAINRTITQLRRILNDSASEQKFIQTIPKKGYRLKITTGQNVQSESKSVSEPESESEKTQTKNSHLSGKQKTFHWLSFVNIGIVLLGIFIIIKFDIFSSQSTNNPPLSFTPLTSKSGIEAYPAFSNNGKYLAYSYQKSNKDNWQIIIKALDTQQEAIIYQSKAVNLKPVWSGNDEQIAFVEWNNLNEKLCAVYLIELDLTDLFENNYPPSKKLFDCGARSFPHISWHPQSNRFVFNDRQSISDAYALYQYSPDTAQKEQITLPPQSDVGHFGAEISPNGKQVALLNYIDEKQTEILIINLSDNKAQLKKKFNQSLSRLAWLSNSKLLLESNNQLMVYDINTQKQQALNKNHLPPRLTQATYFTAQDKLAATEVISQSNIWQANLSNSDIKHSPKQIIHSSRSDFSPKYANLSDNIAFYSTRSGNLQLWLQRENGKLKQLTHEVGGLAFSPLRWSHNDQFLLFKLNGDIVQIDIKTQQVTKRLDKKLGAYNFEFATNNQDIIFSSKNNGDWQLWITNSINNKPTQLTQKGGYGPRTSKDGQWIYYTKFHQKGLWKMPISGGDETLMTDNFSIINWLHWQLTETGAYYIDVNTKAAGIYFYDFKTNQSSLVLKKSANQSNDFSISNRSNHIVFSQVDSTQSDIYLSNETINSLLSE